MRAERLKMPDDDMREHDRSALIYLDNAATTMHKPAEVIEAVCAALETFGGVGRGAHPASVAAGLAVYEARAAIADLLGAPDAAHVAFTLNATMALNIAIAGLLPDGGKAVTTAASHNSVLRPLFAARDRRGCTVEVASVDGEGALDYDELARMADGADLVIVTHASNLTGDVYDAERIARIAHDAGAYVVLDAAQTAGAIPVDMAALGVDALCFTGHKALLGPQGTGGLCVAEGVDIAPLLEGGTGTHSFDERHPRILPESLEAGTPNAHGLAGLAAGVAFVRDRGVGDIAAHEAFLVERLEAGVEPLPGFHVLGGRCGIGRCGIVALDVDGADSALIADRLASEWGICTRAGAHCAPLMHRALGTHERGACRLSFSPFSTEGEVDVAVAALEVIARDLSAGGSEEGAGI